MTVKTCEAIFLWPVLIAMTLVISIPMPMMAAEQAPQPALELLTIGKPPSAGADLEISADRPASPGFMPGDPLRIQLRARNILYLLAIHVSSDGTVTILFPNETIPYNRLEPGKEYALFAKDCGIDLRVGSQADRGGTVFYTSRKPFNLDRITFPKQRACFTLPPAAKEEIGVIKEALTAMEGIEGFARIDFPVKDDVGNLYDVRVVRTHPGQMQETVGRSPQERKPRSFDKGLPTGLNSDRPESITGAVGHRSKVKAE